MLFHTQIDELITADLPVSNVHAFTTTRCFPKTDHFAASDWPQTTHPRGNEIEKSFSEHGCPLASLLPAPPLWLHQIHGAAVFDANHIDIAHARAQPPAVDAAVTNEKNVVLAVLTADCLPVVFACPKSKTIAIAHAGWRGLASGVLENTVATMVAPPEHLNVWLGPAIGGSAFEVGEDVFHAFNAAKDDETASCFRATTPEHWLADLYALARLKLHRLGVAQIRGGQYCTYSDPQRFYSYRRQRDNGRMATFVWRI